MAEDNTNDGTTDDTTTDDTTTDDTTGTDDTAGGEGGDDKAGSDKGDDKLGDAGKKALEAMKRERNAARKALTDAQAKLKEYDDKGKSETQRLTESAESANSRATKAEQGYRKLQTAIDRAPEGATLVQIKAVAKRLSGDSDEEMEADADELFALFAPKTKAPNGKPRENLRGGGDPAEEPEETDPRKLADLIGRP